MLLPSSLLFPSSRVSAIALACTSPLNSGGSGWLTAYQRRSTAGARHRLPTRVGDLASWIVHEPCVATFPILGPQESIHDLGTSRLHVVSEFSIPLEVGMLASH